MPPCVVCRRTTSSGACKRTRRNEHERRKNRTRQCLDSVTALILTTRADLSNSIDDEPEARSTSKDKEKETGEIRARLAALKTCKHQILSDLLPPAALAVRQSSSSVASPARHPLAPAGLAPRQLLPSVASANRQPLVPLDCAGRQFPPLVALATRKRSAPANFPALAAPAARKPSQEHTDFDDCRDSSTPWSTVVMRSRHETQQASPHDAYLDIRVS